MLSEQSGRPTGLTLSVVGLLDSEPVGLVGYGFHRVGKRFFEYRVNPDYYWRIFFDTDIDYGPGKGTLSTGIYVPSLVGITPRWHPEKYGLFGPNVLEIAGKWFANPDSLYDLNRFRQTRWLRKPRPDVEVLRLAVEDLRSLMMDHVVPWFERMPTLADAAAFREAELASYRHIISLSWVELGAMWYRAGDISRCEECWARAEDDEDKEKALARACAVLGHC